MILNVFSRLNLVSSDAQFSQSGTVSCSATRKRENKSNVLKKTCLCSCFQFAQSDAIQWYTLINRSVRKLLVHWHLQKFVLYVILTNCKTEKITSYFLQFIPPRLFFFSPSCLSSCFSLFITSFFPSLPLSLLSPVPVRCFDQSSDGLSQEESVCWPVEERPAALSHLCSLHNAQSCTVRHC